MKSKNTLVLHGPLLLLALLFAGCVSQPSKHPAYLHALSDLRTARWMLEHRPGDAAVSAHESEAVSEIDRAIEEIKRAAIDDGKNIHNQPPAGVPSDYAALHATEQAIHDVEVGH